MQEHDTANATSFTFLDVVGGNFEYQITDSLGPNSTHTLVRAHFSYAAGLRIRSMSQLPLRGGPHHASACKFHRSSTQHMMSRISYVSPPLPARQHKRCHNASPPCKQERISAGSRCITRSPASLLACAAACLHRALSHIYHQQLLRHSSNMTSKTLHLQVHDTVYDQLCPQRHNIDILRCTGHQHFGGQCIELINLDKNEPICKSCPDFGIKWGVPGDEAGYVVKIEDDTLPAPYTIAPGTHVRMVVSCPLPE